MPPTGSASGPQRDYASDDAKARRFFALLLALIVVYLWAVPLRSSFWLDETATFWVIKDGIPQLLARSFQWAGQSPLYYLVDWVALTAGGRHEWVLRLPSFLALAVALRFLYKLASRLFDSAAAQIAVLVFACSESVAFAAADARPYALGLCLLIGAALALVLWLDTGRLRYAAAHVLFSALVIYNHYLFGPALVVLGCYALWRARRQRQPSIWKLLAAWTFAGVLTLPLISQLAGFFKTRAVHTFASTPQPGDLFAALVPPVLAGSIALGLLLVWLISPGQLQSKFGVKKENLLLAIFWAITPPLLLFGISIFTPTKLFVERYYISAMPGLALAAGWLIRSVVDAAGRRVVATVLVLAAIISFGSLTHGAEDWSGAMRAIHAEAAGGDLPVVAPSGFVEATSPEALENPALHDVLFAPLLMYPPGERLIRLPYRLDTESAQYIERLLPELSKEKRFVLVVRYAGLTYEPWFSGRLAAAGFRSARLGDFGGLGVFLFTR